MRISDWSSDVCSSDLGIRSALGVKVTGPDLRGISELTAQLETILRGVSGTRAVFGDRLTGGRYIDVDIDRVRAAQYGVRAADIERLVASAIGGEEIGTVMDGDRNSTRRNSSD